MRGILNVFLVLNCTLICIYFNGGVAAEQGPTMVIVDTNFGEVEGYQTEHARVFKGIPFGGSVSGSNRWKDAYFPDAWRPDILDATNYPPVCPQDCSGADCLPQSEDCLYLNVYTPLSATDQSNYPVLVFIHGGAFTIGSAATLEGSALASSSEIIVVTIHYRLGALGFLVYGPSDGDPTIRGNFGIKDQNLALQWVQNNINAFGGNKDDVTISGQSAGAMSVAIHMTREDHTELFHKAIVESDPFGINYRTVDDAKALGDDFSQVLECDTVDCMRNKNYTDIVNAQEQIFVIPIVLSSPLLVWAPVVDVEEDVLTTQPLEAFRSGHSIKVPTIMGTTTEEGIMFVYSLLLAIFNEPISEDIYKGLIFLMFGGSMEHYRTVYELYSGPIPDTPDYYGLLLSQILTDYQYYCPTVLAAKSSSSVDNPVYSYIFDQPWNTTWGGDPEIDQLCAIYACHAAELPYVFLDLDALQSPAEKRLAGIVSKYWGTFVKTGDPNSPENRKKGSIAGATHWPSNPRHRFIDLKIDAQNIEVVYNDREEKCLALNEIGYGANLFEALYKAVTTILQPPQE